MGGFRSFFHIPLKFTRKPLTSTSI